MTALLSYARRVSGARRPIAALAAILALLITSLVALAGPAGARAGSTTCKTASLQAATRVGHIGGIVAPMTRGCAGRPDVGNDDPPIGAPPLINHGGAVMSTPSVGGKTVMTPIFWEPPGYSFTTGYKNVIVQYLNDLAATSGAQTNVFATTAEYSGSNGAIQNGFAVGTPIDDTHAYPSAGCTTNTGAIYSDGSEYLTCIDNSQATAEISSLLTAGNLPSDYGHMYLLFLPKQVESCYYAGNPGNQQCSVNPTSTAKYCAFHSWFGNNTMWAMLPFPIYASPTGHTCGNEYKFGSEQAPNGEPDADTVISPLSHEMAEAITDPHLQTWYDAQGYENGDECNFVYGSAGGVSGAEYNQTINGHHYLTQEEFSNSDWAATNHNGGCLQGMSAAVPSVSSVSPSSGPTAGGTSVTITGSNFTGADSVTFGGTAATYTVDSATQITATAPTHVAGTVHVVVTTGDGSSTTGAADQFTYNPPAPTVTGVSPNSGPTAGGETVTITGTDFTDATEVDFGTTPASFTVHGATQITTKAPAHRAGTVDVTVTTPAGTSTASSADHFTYDAPTPAPTVTGVTPDSGLTTGGETVTITGTTFTGATEVDFGATSANFTADSATQLTATAPAGSAGTIDVTVTTPAGTSTTSTADHYTYNEPTPAPTVTGVSPHSGRTAGGTTVTITGTDFTGATEVDFGTNSASFSVIDDTTIRATSPARAAGTVDVTVTTPAGTSSIGSADRFTYRRPPRPVVTSISPRSGSHRGGTRVTIKGTGFVAGATVHFGAKAGKNLHVVSATKITVKSPAHAKGRVHVTVHTSGGTSQRTNADKYKFT